MPINATPTWLADVALEQKRPIFLFWIPDYNVYVISALPADVLGPNSLAGVFGYGNLGYGTSSYGG